MIHPVGGRISEAVEGRRRPTQVGAAPRQHAEDGRVSELDRNERWGFALLAGGVHQVSLPPELGSLEQLGYARRVTVPRVTPGKHFTGAPDPRAPGGSPSRSGALLVTAQDRR